MNKQPTIKPLGDKALQVNMGDSPSGQLHGRIMAFCHRLGQILQRDITECVPAMTSVTVYYEPHVITFGVLRDKLQALFAELPESPAVGGELVTVPVCYGGRHGQDLEDVAKLHGLSTSQVIDLHAAGEYLVYMMGFAPGFPYLTGLDERLATPRLATPRTSVRAGSVGIGGSQTGIYPLATPGGWRIIGHAPIRLWDPNSERPFLLSPGDRVRFAPITLDEHYRIEMAVEAGAYQVQRQARREDV